MEDIVLNDPLFTQQWYLNNTGQSGGTVGEDINVLEAWEIATGDGVVIGIVDNGLQFRHPELNNQYRATLSFDFADDNLNPDSFNEIRAILDVLRDVLPDDLSSILDEYLGSLQATNPGEEENSNIPTIFDFLDVSENLADFHGTAVAGIALAQGNNGIGVRGVAYNADLAGLRIETDSRINSNILDAQLANALSHRNQDIDIYNNSWQLSLPLIPLGQITSTKIRNSINEGRGGLGSIYVFAAGNDGQTGGNVNYNGLANSRFTIAVGAIDHNGVQSSYSNPGTSLLISAYGNGDDEGLISTDLQGEDGYNLSLSLSTLNNDYTQFFGTSAATSIVSGVIALMLEANPNLTWRDVQHILVATATQNDPSNTDWTENGAGYLVNHNYGFGAINAGDVVNTALNWEPVEEEVRICSEIVNVSTNIPDNDPIGFTSSIIIADNLNIEWIEIITDSDLVNDDLEVILTSPSGTRSILSPQGSGLGIDDTSFNENWTFSSVRHWGESSAGEWSLTVIENQSSNSEIFWDDWQLNFYGTSETETNISNINQAGIRENNPAEIIEDTLLTSTSTNNLPVFFNPIREIGAGAGVGFSFPGFEEFSDAEGNTILVNQNISGAGAGAGLPGSSVIVPNFANNPFFTETISSNIPNIIILDVSEVCENTTITENTAIRTGDDLILVSIDPQIVSNSNFVRSRTSNSNTDNDNSNE
ncbi:MAG: S8 family serine peptidase [Xenococcus sp. (in: cyanobacteria)]